jgi:CxxC motif-containing protein (DUF1111 family)
MQIGRFGWKANQPGLMEQDAGALNRDMGLTTRIFPRDNGSDLPHGGEPEVEDKQLNLLVHYSRFLAVPRRGQVAGSFLKAAARRVIGLR